MYIKGVMSVWLHFSDDFQDDVGPVPSKKTKITAKAKIKAKEEAKSKEPVTLKRKERYVLYSK